MHGILFINKRLLISCDTGIYAIMSINLMSIYPVATKIEVFQFSTSFTLTFEVNRVCISLSGINTLSYRKLWILVLLVKTSCTSKSERKRDRGPHGRLVHAKCL